MNAATKILGLGVNCRFWHGFLDKDMVLDERCAALYLSTLCFPSEVLTCMLVLESEFDGSCGVAA